jgi:thiol-disulfide isomerase/thioredoxin
METKKANKKPTLSFFTIAFVIVVFIVIGAQFFKSRSGNAASLVGSKAPAIQIVEWITRQPPDLKGHVYVLDFWATWCPPCVQSIPHMIELTAKYKDRAVLFIAVSVDNSSEPVKKMVRSKGITYHVGMDNGLAEKYSVRSIPSTFIIGRSGQVVWQGHPRQSDFETALVNALNAPPTQSQTNTK